MYFMYPLAFLAGFLIWATINYLENDSEAKKEEFDQRL